MRFPGRRVAFSNRRKPIYRTAQRCQNLPQNLGQQLLAGGIAVTAAEERLDKGRHQLESPAVHRVGKAAGENRSTCSIASSPTRR